MAVLSKLFIAGVGTMASLQGANAGLVRPSATGPAQTTPGVTTQSVIPTPTNGAAGIVPPPSGNPGGAPSAPFHEMPPLPLPPAGFQQPDAPFPAQYVTLVGEKGKVNALVPPFAVYAGMARTYVAVPAGFELKKKTPAEAKNPGHQNPSYGHGPTIVIPTPTNGNNTVTVPQVGQHPTSSAAVEKGTATVTASTSTTTEPTFTTVGATVSAASAITTATEPTFTTVEAIPSVTAPASETLEPRQILPFFPDRKKPTLDDWLKQKEFEDWYEQLPDSPTEQQE